MVEGRLNQNSPLPDRDRGTVRQKTGAAQTTPNWPMSRLAAPLPPGIGAFFGAIWSYERTVGTVIVLSVLVRLICAASTPLAFDEALYWTYSKHLAAGYLDHPAMNPLLIRIGTTLFGDTSLGVRVMAVLLGLPASWAVWRSASNLFKDEKIGATAALFFNLTLVMTVGSLLATSDPVVVTASAFLLYFLVKVDETGRGSWWLGVGAAFGLGMFSKYTTLFFAVSILAWLVLVPERRRWLINPWPWAGAALAIAIFSPVLVWNAQHHWASFVYQAGRLTIHKWSIRYIAELIGAQIGMATPPIFVLGLLGGFSVLKDEPRSTRVLLGAMILPILAYFLWHSLHERVQGNWLEPIYPAFVVSAALAAHRLNNGRGALAKVAIWSERAALPLGLALAGILYLQAIFGILPIGRKDPTARMLGAGWTTLGAKIDAIRAQIGAPVVLTTDYTMTGWLSFYLPSHTPVEQITERIRWIDAPAPEPQIFGGQMLYVCRGTCPGIPALEGRFRIVQHLATLPRERNGATVAEYSLYRLASPLGPVLDPPYPVPRAG